jgi:REP element-mobilizing transposase RayT
MKQGLEARLIIGRMPQTLSFTLVHIIFSTKDRRPLLTDAIRTELFPYLATVVRDKKCECFRAGGVADHVHLAVRLHPTTSLAKLVEEAKVASSKWLKVKGVSGFGWQRGYAAFSVSPADVGAVVRYIEGQEAHHRRRDFQEEMRAFLEKYHVVFDERYVWD